MKRYFLILLAVLMSFAALAPSAEARPQRHYKKQFHRSERHHYRHVRNHRREYHRGHYAWRNHHRYWVPARYVVVYF